MYYASTFKLCIIEFQKTRHSSFSLLLLFVFPPQPPLLVELVFYLCLYFFALALVSSQGSASKS